MGWRWSLLLIGVVALGTTSSVGWPAEIEAQSSRVFVFVAKKGLGHEHAVSVPLSTGVLHLGAQRGAGRLTWDLRACTADTSEARAALGLKGDTDDATRKQVDQNMLGAAVLNVAKFPSAEFLIESALPTGRRRENADEFELRGQFTLHGVTRTLRFPVVVEEREEWLLVRGTVPLRQTDFGIQPFTKGLGLIGVADEVQAHGILWVRRENRAQKVEP